MTSLDIQQLAARFSHDLTVTKLADRSGVILDLQGRQVLSTNEVGMAIIRALCEPGASRDTVLSAIAQSFSIDAKTAAQDCDEFLTALQTALIDSA